MLSYFRRGCVVSEKNPNEKDKKLRPLEVEESGTTSSLSSAGLPSSDRSLERILGAIDQTIKSFTSVEKMVYEEVRTQGKLSSARHEMLMQLVGKMRVELAVLTDQLGTFITGSSIQLGATVEAKNALDRTREKLESAVQDLSGQHEKYDPTDDKGEAPRVVQAIAVKVTNFVWPSAVRTGKAAMLYGFKLVAGSVTLGAVGKLCHMLLTLYGAFR